MLMINVKNDLRSYWPYYENTLQKYLELFSFVMLHIHTIHVLHTFIWKSEYKSLVGITRGLQL